MKIKEAPVRAIGLYDLTAVGEQEPLLRGVDARSRPRHQATPRAQCARRARQGPCNARGSYTIRPAGTMQRGQAASARVPVGGRHDGRVPQGQEDAERGACTTPGSATTTMFTMALEELQRSGAPLKKVRRGAQGMIISGETRFVTSKDKLIADLFVRNCATSPASLMHEVGRVQLRGRAAQRSTSAPRTSTSDSSRRSSTTPTRSCTRCATTSTATPRCTTRTPTRRPARPRPSSTTTGCRRTTSRPSARSCSAACSASRRAPRAGQAWETDKAGGQGPRPGDPPPPLGQHQVCEETKVAKDAITDEQIGDAVPAHAPRLPEADAAAAPHGDALHAHRRARGTSRTRRACCPCRSSA